MTYYLGVDVGTTSVKAVAFSPEGQMLAHCSFSYEMHHPQPERHEQDPDEIFEATIKGINKVVQKLAPHLPVFVSFSAAMHSFIAVNKEGNLLTKCIIWADNRAAAIADNLRSSDKGMHFYQSSGVPVHAMSPLCKLLWFKENEPAVFNGAFKFIGIKEYIFFKLFGSYFIDTSVASATGLLNMKTLQWDEEILKYAGVDASRLSQVVSPKHVLNYNGIVSSLLLPKNTPFVMGASDGALSNLGTGATGPDAMAVTIGTSGAARIVISKPQTDSNMRTFCYHLKDDWHIYGGANNNGAVVLQWLKETLLQTSDDYDQLYTLAETVNAGCDGLLFLPYLLGERAPLWNSNARGVLFGLTIAHTKAHTVRAAMEGVVFCLYSIGKILMENNAITKLLVSGGFVKSHLWLQILADVFNIKVLVPAAAEGAALGAVMLGAEALNIPIAFDNAITASYEPAQKNHEIYTASFAKFERLYDLLKTEM